MCEFSYYLNYILGIENEPNIKTVKGSISHKALELLSRKKLAEQRGNPTFSDVELNKTWHCESFDVDIAFSEAWDFYVAKHPEFSWDNATRDHCYKMTLVPLEFKDGLFSPLKRTIIEPEQYFDFEIKEPWAYYIYDITDPEGNKQKIEGYLAVKGTMDLLVYVSDDVYELVDWKGLPVETQIPTTDGWKTMGDLEVGDTVFDEDGQPTKILGKSKVKLKKCYRITFEDNISVIADDEHLWKLKDDSVLATQELTKEHEIKVYESTERNKKLAGKIKCVQHIGKRQTQCIMVDSPKRTYLCTKNMIVTHNTGKRLDWASGQVKDYKKLRNDPQLRLYHYALHRLYPEISQFIISIYFLADNPNSKKPEDHGGPFTLCFTEEDIPKTEEMLKKKFEAIKNSYRPKQRITWRCKAFCHYGKTKYKDTDKTICQHMGDELDKLGYDEAFKKYGDYDKIGRYGEGGGRTHEKE